MRFISMCVVSLSIGAAYGLVPAPRKLIAREVDKQNTQQFPKPNITGPNITGSSQEFPKTNFTGSSQGFPKTNFTGSSQGFPKTNFTGPAGVGLFPPPFMPGMNPTGNISQQPSSGSTEKKIQKLEEKIGKEEVKLAADKAELARLQGSSNNGQSGDRSHEFPQLGNVDHDPGKQNKSGIQSFPFDAGVTSGGQGGGNPQSFNASGPDNNVQPLSGQGNNNASGSEEGANPKSLNASGQSFNASGQSVNASGQSVNASGLGNTLLPESGQGKTNKSGSNEKGDPQSDVDNSVPLESDDTTSTDSSGGAR